MRSTMCAGTVSSGLVELYSRLLILTPSMSQRMSWHRDPLQRAAHVVERAVLGCQVEPGHLHLQALRNIVEPAELQFVGRDDLHAVAELLQVQGYRFLQAGALHDDLLLNAVRRVLGEGGSRRREREERKR